MDPGPHEEPSQRCCPPVPPGTWGQSGTGGPHRVLSPHNIRLAQAPRLCSPPRGSTRVQPRSDTAHFSSLPSVSPECSWSVVRPGNSAAGEAGTPTTPLNSHPVPTFSRSFLGLVPAAKGPALVSPFCLLIRVKRCHTPDYLLGTKDPRIPCHRGSCLGSKGPKVDRYRLCVHNSLQRPLWGRCLGWGRTGRREPELLYTVCPSPAFSLTSLPSSSARCYLPQGL